MPPHTHFRALVATAAPGPRDARCRPRTPLPKGEPPRPANDVLAPLRLPPPVPRAAPMTEPLEARADRAGRRQGWFWLLLAAVLAGALIGVSHALADTWAGACAWCFAGLALWAGLHAWGQSRRGLDEVADGQQGAAS